MRIYAYYVLAELFKLESIISIHIIYSRATKGLLCMWVRIVDDVRAGGVRH